MTNYSETAIKKWLRENVESEVQRAQILNMVEGAAELAYQRGLAHGQGKRFAGRPVAEPTMSVHVGGKPAVVARHTFEEINL